MKHKVSARVAAGAVGVAMIVSLGLGVATQASAAGLTSSQIQSILSLLQSFGADQATINNVNSALTGTAMTGGSTGTMTSSSSCYSWTRDLTLGSTGADVKALQQFLNANGAMIASSGAGSPGNESTYFGSLTQKALASFQAMHAITPSTGYFGPKTRAAIASMCAGGTVSTGTGSVVPTGPGITVSASAQPVNALAPYNAVRVPFTTFTLTNNTSAAVVVNSVTIQRSGLGNDTNFSGVVLLDQNGLQIGIAQTLNSNHQANIGSGGFTLNPGQSETFTVAGNMAAAATVQAGAVVSLSVVGINTSVPVNGSLPITGAMQTVNATVQIGAVSTSTSSYDPGAAQTKPIGSTAVRFTGVRFTANSSEDVKLYSIRWRQVGTAGATDIGNVMTYVNGTSYPTSVDASGKYYTTLFAGGISILKGNSVDVYIQGDLTGTNSASRTVQMTIDKSTDVYFIGQTYGYGVAFTPVYNTQPAQDGNIVTIQAGSATTIQSNTAVASQNIPVNVNNTVLGGFTTNFTGEQVSVQGMYFAIATSSATWSGSPQPTSVSIVDSNGHVVAGPVDTIVGDGSHDTSSCTNTSTYCLLHFTDTVTFPVGVQNYTIVGKVPSGFPNGVTVTLSTTPSSDWSNVTGQISGNTITLSTGQFNMSTMTVKGATLTITASPNPVAQNIVSGNAVTLGAIQLDASQSGEDIRMNSIPVYFESVAGTLTSNLNSCQLYNGSTALNTGTNVPTGITRNGTGSGAMVGVSATANTFQFDNSLVIPKGTVMTLTMKCNISSSLSTGDFTTGVYTSGTYSATGVQSGNSVTQAATGPLTVTTGVSGVQTVASKGTFTATVDSSSPSYALVAAGTSGVTVGVVKLHASNEDINLSKLALQLTLSGNTLSSGSGATTNHGVNDITQVRIYNGATQVGSVTFTGTQTFATSSLTSTVLLPKDTDVLLTLKADLASISASGPGGVGDVVKVDPLNAEGSGASSGQTVKITASTGVAGVQMFKSYPVVADSGFSPSNPNGTAQKLKQFTITANSAGPVGLYQVAVKIATTSASVTSVQLFAYTDTGCSLPANVSGTTAGQFGGTAALGGLLDIANPQISFIQTTPLQIPASQTYCFVVKGTVTPSSATATTWSVNTTVLGDSATSSLNVAGTNANIATGIGETQSSNLGYATSTTANHNHFIWSDDATSTSATINDVDWFDGYFVQGLSSGGF